MERSAVEARGEEHGFLNQILTYAFCLDPLPDLLLPGADPVVVVRQVTGHSTNAVACLTMSQRNRFRFF